MQRAARPLRRSLRAAEGREVGLKKGVSAYVEGVDGKAAAFDGAHYLPAGTIPALAPDDAFTWSAWINVAPEGSLPDVVLGNRVLEEGDTLEFMKVTRGDVQYFGGEGNSVKLPHGAPAGEWTHLAVVKDGRTLRCYRDGREVATAEADFGTPELPFYLAGDPRARESTTCTLDEARLYREALGERQIQRLADRQPLNEEPYTHLPLDGEGD